MQFKMLMALFDTLPALQTSAQQREFMRKQFLGGKARNGLEFQMFQRNLKKSGATDPCAIATQLQSSLEKSATAHKKLSAMLDNAKRVRLESILSSFTPVKPQATTLPALFQMQVAMHCCRRSTQDLGPA